MLPFYTRFLNPSDFGTVDLIVSTVNLLLPIFTLSISEAVLRFALDKNESKKSVFSLGLLISLVGFIILLVLLFPINVFLKLPMQLCVMFLLIYITTMLYTLLNQFLRGINCVKVFAINGVLSSVTLVLSNIILLFLLKAGIIGYLLSIVISNIISIIYITFRVNLLKYITVKFDFIRLKRMLEYCIPLIITTISWWVLFSSDRYVLNILTGLGAVGIYSAANRIPVILTSVTDVFMKAWQLSAVNEYESENRNQYYGQIYKYYNILLLILCSLFVIFSTLIAKILFAAEFYSAWKSAPFLMLSAVFSALNGFIGSLYTTAKNTKNIFITTVIGAIVNIGFNFLLIPTLNEVGAAIATLIAFFLVWLIRCLTIPEQFKSVGLINRKFCVSYAIVLIQCFLMLSQFAFKYVIIVALFLLIILIFIRDILQMVKVVMPLVNKMNLTKKG